MGTTNQPTPVILDDEALAEIEARRPRTVHYNCPFVPLSETERDALCQTVRALRTTIERLGDVGLRNAQLVDTIRAWSKCPDGYPLDEHVNNIATQLAQIRETLTTIEACKNPKCGHCMALLRTVRRG